jgi:hypothetical protein
LLETFHPPSHNNLGEPEEKFNDRIVATVIRKKSVEMKKLAGWYTRRQMEEDLGYDKPPGAISIYFCIAFIETYLVYNDNIDRMS